jgi:phage terminase small subunit
MDTPDTLAEHLAPIWDEMVEQVDDKIGAGGLEALCIQVHRMRAAQARITDEGEIVTDAKGNAVPHPAIAIEQKAGAEIRTWVKAFPARGRRKAW